MGTRLGALVILIFAAVTTVFGEGKFAVLTYPSHVKFVATKKNIDSIEIPFVISNLFGLPTSYNLKWNGLLEGNPFIRPKAVALFSIYASKLDESVFTDAQMSYQTTKKHWGMDESYINNQIEGITWEEEPLLIETSLDNQLLDIKSTYAEESFSLSLDSLLDELQASIWFRKHNLKSLNTSSDVDLTFIGELYGIVKVINMLQKHPEITKKASPDFYNFKVIGLRSLNGGEKLKEAWMLLESVIREATASLKGIYGNNVVVAAAVLTADPRSETDIGRHLQEMTTVAPHGDKNESIYNYAPQFTEAFPVMFNIILWFTIAFALALLWISWSIWHMDPGKDSVIYRMTTQRLKRD